MTQIKLGIVQCRLDGSPERNFAHAARFVKEAASQGAQIILTPELIEGPYFCKNENDAFFALAKPLAGHPAVAFFSDLAKQLGVVLPVSLFEMDGPHYYNTVVVVNADGGVLGHYRKSHIPAGPGYQEKYYFKPGNTGYRTWQTRYGNVGVGICWDQWFPECARGMALLGAELLLYPTAIGSEPHNAGLDTKDPWQRVMVGHAVANMMPVAAANRVGDEDGQVFYGSSFVCDHFGNMLVDMGRAEEGARVVGLDLAQSRRDRAAFGFFRDRRSD